MESAKPLTIEFASCNRQNLPQDYWSILQQYQPDAFIWLGDAAYMTSNTLASQTSALAQAKSNTEYSRFASSTVILGTWDDHDYGVNDGGRLVSNRKDRQNAFLDFLGLADSALRAQDGIYYSRDFFSHDVRVKFLFLDTRYHRDSHYTRSLGEIHLPYTALAAAFVRFTEATFGFSAYHDGSVLGEEQWRWLERSLRLSTADVHVIVSSIQIATTNPVVESWGHFPKDKAKLFDLLKKYDPPGLIMLSGDVHHAEMSKIRYSRKNGEVGEWLEFTSSGLTHTCRDNMLTKFVCPLMLDTYLSHRVEADFYFMEKNFGLFQISQCDNEDVLSPCVAVVNVTLQSLDSSRSLSHSLQVLARRSSPIHQVHVSKFQNVLQGEISIFRGLIGAILFSSLLVLIVLPPTVYFKLFYRRNIFPKQSRQNFARNKQ